MDETIATVVAGLLTTGLGWVLLALRKWLATKAEATASQGLQYILWSAASIAVAEVQQRVVDDAVKKHGLLSPDVAKTVKADAVHTMKNLVGEAALKRISKQLKPSNVNDFLGSFVESAVADKKRKAAFRVASQPTPST